MKLIDLATRLEFIANNVKVMLDEVTEQDCDAGAAALRECEAVLRETAAFDDGHSVYWWGNPQTSVMKRIRKLLGDE